MTDNEKTSATAMRDNEIIKALGEVSSEKIKAIYPHIVVSGDIDKPYYSIQYYDIEKKTMFDCYGSYKLGLVRKWLEEHFEVIEPDIADFINRQKAEIERLEEVHKSLEEAYKEQENYEDMIIKGAEVCDRCHEEYAEKIKQAKAEAFKEFAERLCDGRVSNDPVVIAVKCELKETVGE